MKNKFSRILCTALCCAPLLAAAQTDPQATDLQRYYQEGRNLFQQKAYTASVAPLQTFIRLADRQGAQPSLVEERQEAEYMLVCASYEMQDPRSLDLLADYLDKYPDTPHANRIYALMASGYFFRYDYERALMLFGRSRDLPHGHFLPAHRLPARRRHLVRSPA